MTVRRVCQSGERVARRKRVTRTSRREMGWPGDISRSGELVAISGTQPAEAAVAGRGCAGVAGIPGDEADEGVGTTVVAGAVGGVSRKVRPLRGYGGRR